jgi:hypothetical protein
MNNASRVKREKSYQPSNYKENGQDIKYTSHISLFFKDADFNALQFD